MKKKIGFVLVLLFVISVNMFAKSYSLREAITLASDTLCKKIDGKVDVVAIFDIYSDFDKLSEYINGELVHEFTVSLNKTDVAERNLQSLAAIEKELDYQYSGNVSDSTIQSLGYALGADAIVYGSLEEDASGWKLDLKVTQVETKKVLASWKGTVGKNDKDITFQIKKSTNVKKEEKKKDVKLIDPKVDKDLPDFNLKKIATMYETDLTYSDIAEIFIQRFGIEYVNKKSYVISSNYGYESSDDIKKRKGEFAWTVYASPDNAYTLLMTNAGGILLSSYYEDGKMYGIESKYFMYSFTEFLYKISVNLKAAGKSLSYDEISAFNKILLGFENSSYYDKYTTDYRPNLIDHALMTYETEGHGVSSKVFIEMCVKSGFLNDSHDNSILHNSVTMDAYEGGYEITKLLIKLGIDINIKNMEGVTPLMYAIEEFDISDCAERCAELLLETGADVNVQDKQGSTALIYAIENDVSSRFIKSLIKNGADVNIENDFEETPLSLAKQKYNDVVVKILIQAGAK